METVIVVVVEVVVAPMGGTERPAQSPPPHRLCGPSAACGPCAPAFPCLRNTATNIALLLLLLLLLLALATKRVHGLDVVVGIAKAAASKRQHVTTTTIWGCMVQLLFFG